MKVSALLENDENPKNALKRERRSVGHQAAIIKLRLQNFSQKLKDQGIAVSANPTWDKETWYKPGMFNGWMAILKTPENQKVIEWFKKQETRYQQLDKRINDIDIEMGKLNSEEKRNARG